MEPRFARLLSGAVAGIDALRIDVEVDVSRTGDPQIVVVGLPDAGVKESHHRVSTALANSGFDPFRGRIVVNLAPADVHKDGSLFEAEISVSKVKLLRSDTLLFAVRDITRRIQAMQEKLRAQAQAEPQSQATPGPVRITKVLRCAPKPTSP